MVREGVILQTALESLRETVFKEISLTEINVKHFMQVVGIDIGA